jgi:hypothetical protein
MPNPKETASQRKRRGQLEREDGSGKGESSNGSQSKKTKSSASGGKKTPDKDNGGAAKSSNNILEGASGGVGSRKSAPGSTSSQKSPLADPVCATRSSAAVPCSSTAVPRSYTALPRSSMALPRSNGKDSTRSAPTSSGTHSLQVLMPSRGGVPHAPTSSGQRSVQQLEMSSSPFSVPVAIIHSGERGIDESSLVTENNSALYVHEKNDAKKEQEHRMTQLKEYVRNDLFPGWKFFSSKKQMVFSNRQGGIVLKICNDLSVRPESQMYWWDMHKKNILEALNRKRNDVTAYLKKQFCCKLHLIGVTIVAIDHCKLTIVFILLIDKCGKVRNYEVCG